MIHKPFNLREQTEFSLLGEFRHLKSQKPIFDPMLFTNFLKRFVISEHLCTYVKREGIMLSIDNIVACD